MHFSLIYAQRLETDMLSPSTLLTSFEEVKWIRERRVKSVVRAY